MGWPAPPSHQQPSWAGGGGRAGEWELWAASAHGARGGHASALSSWHGARAQEASPPCFLILWGRSSSLPCKMVPRIKRDNISKGIASVQPQVPDAQQPSTEPCWARVLAGQRRPLWLSLSEVLGWELRKAPRNPAPGQPEPPASHWLSLGQVPISQPIPAAMGMCSHDWPRSGSHVPSAVG